MHHFLITLLIISAAGCGSNRNNKEGLMGSSTPFEWRIVNSGFVRSETPEIIFTDTSIRIVKGSASDSIKFTTRLEESDTLSIIAALNPSSFSDRYSNDMIADGLQLTVQFTKADTTRTIFVSNAYEPRIGMVISYINARIPEQYQVWYDKKDLERRD